MIGYGEEEEASAPLLLPAKGVGQRRRTWVAREWWDESKRLWRIMDWTSSSGWRCTGSTSSRRPSSTTSVTSSSPPSPSPPPSSPTSTSALLDPSPLHLPPPEGSSSIHARASMVKCVRPCRPSKDAVQFARACSIVSGGGGMAGLSGGRLW